MKGTMRSLALWIFSSVKYPLTVLSSSASVMPEAILAIL